MNPASPQQILLQTFGYHEFRGQQAAIVEHLCRGQDALVIMPTGAGKSLCYQVPALHRPGTAVVVSPLIALMQDQVDSLKVNNVRAAYLNSSMSAEAAWQTEQALREGQLDLIYLAPERLMQERTLAMLEQIEVSLFAIDEAHCVSQWGHDFRPEYQQLSILASRFPNIPRVALTATADEPTRKEIIEQLQLHSAEQFISGFDRPNISYHIHPFGKQAKENLWRFLQLQHPSDSGIVYCLSRNKVESIADWLSKQGRRALPYHAGLSAEQREQNQQRFLLEDNIIIVATIAFGMGIDKPDVRFVAHLDIPKSIEAYYQETGRAGRDGQPSNAWMAYNLQSVLTLRKFVEDSNAPDQQKRVERHKLDAMLGLCETSRCRRQILLSYFGDDLPEPCGNCDNCLIPPETIDGTVAAQKALSCAYRTGQRFGVNYLIEILLGKESERAQNFGHTTLGVFGVGKEFGADQWRSIFRQLVASGYMRVDIEGYGALQLNENARPLLRGEESITLRLDRKKELNKPKKAAVSQSAQGPLWDALRAKRTEIAREQGVPPYVIFHDATLMQIAELKPESLDQLANIDGVGPAKLEKYGQAFLSVLKTEQKPTQINEEQVLYELSDGKDAESLADQYQTSESAIYQIAASGVAAGRIDIADFVDLPDESMQLIFDAFELNFDPDDASLKPVHEALEGEFSYDILRLFLAEMFPEALKRAG